MSDACHNWRVATSLPRSGAEPYGSGRYAAANYDELIDYPVEMGSFMLADFEAGGARHDIAVSGRSRTPRASLRAPRAEPDRSVRRRTRQPSAVRLLPVPSARGRGRAR